mgnify:CR=1 FL=1
MRNLLRGYQLTIEKICNFMMMATLSFPQWMLLVSWAQLNGPQGHPSSLITKIKYSVTRTLPVRLTFSQAIVDCEKVSQSEKEKLQLLQTLFSFKLPKTKNDIT